MSSSRPLVAAAVLFAACTAAPDPPPPASASASSASEAPVVPDTLDLAPLDEAALASYLDADKVADILAYDRAFRDAETGDDLKSAYHQALGLLGGEEGPEMEQVTAFMEAELGIAGLLPTCVAECSLASFDLDLPVWQQAAQHVGDESAVAFFDMLVTLYDFPERETDPEEWSEFGVVVGAYDGELVGWPNYRTQTWDYGGYSNVGSGLHADLLDAFVEATGTEGAFEMELQDLREDVVLDLVESTCIGPSAEEAYAEVRRVNDSMVAPDIAQGTYDRRLEALDAPSASDVEVGCAAPDATCACVGG